MNKTENKDYSPELISDAEKILEVYAKLPDNKKAYADGHYECTDQRHGNSGNVGRKAEHLKNR